MSPFFEAVLFQDTNAGFIDIEEEGKEVMQPQPGRLLQGMTDESLADPPA